MLSKLIVSLAAFASLSTALAVRQTPASSTCPFNYPVTLNTTESHNGLVFTIASNNPLTRNRAVQLRSVPHSYGKEPVQVAAIDATSPVLLGQLRGGSIFSENRSEVNQLYDLGPTAGLTLVQDDGVASPNVSRSALEFKNKQAPDSKFNLEAPSDDGTYGLYHQVPDGVTNGFILCEQGKGEWFQLFYQTYQQNPPERPGCEYVGVRTTAAATIYNGKCDIGGYTA